MFHIAATKSVRGRWVTRGILKEIFELPSATRLYAEITSDFVERLWYKLGFDFVDLPDKRRLAYKDA